LKSEEVSNAKIGMVGIRIIKRYIRKTIYKVFERLIRKQHKGDTCSKLNIDKMQW
jgi:hypothetical protein